MATQDAEWRHLVTEVVSVSSLLGRSEVERKGGSQQCRVPESAVVNISHGECLTCASPDSLQAQTLPGLSPKDPNISPKKSQSPGHKPDLPAQEAVVPDDKHPSFKGNFKAYSKETVFTDLRSGNQLHSPLQA